MSDWYDKIKPFKPAEAIAWIEATRITMQTNAYGKTLDFARTVEMIRTFDELEDEDYRALKAIDQMSKDYLNGLLISIDQKAVDKLCQEFASS